MTARHSWIPEGSEPGYGLANLPFGVFRRNGEQEGHCATRVGDTVVDLTALEAGGLLSPALPAGTHLFRAGTLNAFMAAGSGTWNALRERLQDLLATDGDPALRHDTALQASALVPVAETVMELPCTVGGYVDFYASLEHASNLGKMFRPDQEPLLPNWRHLPVAYNGRASSVVVSGTPVKRPSGQTMADGAAAPVFGPTKALDIELEVGFLVGPASALGAPIPIAEAAQHIFGFVLVNDWSARDIQKWEYQPLGPFLGKSFATSISPWIVPFAAVEPFLVDGPVQDPPVLPHLQSPRPAALDLDLSVAIRPADAAEEMVVSRVNFRRMYWNCLQMLAHATSNGCNVNPGDLFASGTVSGDTPDSRGSLIELTWRGRDPLTFPGGSKRTFLQDGDEVTLRGLCAGADLAVSFGACAGRISPALP